MPIYGNDHLLWMLESYIDEKTATDDVEDTQPRTHKELVKRSEESTVPGVSLSEKFEMLFCLNFVIVFFWLRYEY